MPRTAQSQAEEFAAKVREIAEKTLGAKKAAQLTPFIAGYFANMHHRDLSGETAESLFGALYSHWRLGAQRAPGTAVVHVYNPKLDEHGWRSEHTVIEIVNDNMPFIVDSVTAELNRRDLVVHLVIHPIFAVRRDGKGMLVEVADARSADKDMGRESFMHVEIAQQPEDAVADIAAAVMSVLVDVRAAVEDWQAMRGRLGDIIAGMTSPAPGQTSEDHAETRAFLEWLRENNFTFLGYREYVLSVRPSGPIASITPGSGLGVLRDPEVFAFEEARDPTLMPRAVRAFVSRKEPLSITKTDKTATIHRPVPMDAVGIRSFDGDGNVIGLHMFVGLFTASAYNQTPQAIPILRRKIARVIERAGFDPLGHDGKAMLNILATFPRDEFLQVSEEHLYQTALGIVQLQERQRVALFIRRDDYERFVTCLIYIPRDRHTTQLREAMQRILEEAFDGHLVSHQTEVGDSPLARLYLVIRTRTGEIPDYDPATVEARLVEITRTWSDRLLSAMVSAFGEQDAYALHRRYAGAFSASYEERFTADQAVGDIEHLEATLRTKEVQTLLYRPLDSEPDHLRFKVFHPDSVMVLSDVMPVLEHLGLRVLDEHPHDVNVRNGGVVHIHDFGLATRSGGAVDLGAVREPFRQTFLDVWTGRTESDHFNTLVVEAGLACREVVILRAYAKYLRQAGIAFSQSYMEQVLMHNPALSGAVVELFQALFDPDGEASRDDRVGAIRQRITDGLEAVVSADEDRILRRFVNCVEATLRTNYYQPDAEGRPKPYVSFKLDSRSLTDLPLPRPMVEVFVYSPRMEGIHLRGGKVARGGIRWSDRREDFRTEILGLMKAQQVKNAVIVPVGSKGGFVVKRPPPPGDREAFQAEGIACYQTLMRGLLDITDNRVGDHVVPPSGVVRRDEDDPYLVVAADKGTATFSDIANGLSKDYGFWLGDAFASGGSQGYDHKKMGITAKGAWESVKRHFREMGVNTQEEPFTVIGVGDMSGDVFGNGMLLSPHIRLLAAFNHLHILVDPDPDPAASFAERQRMFDLPRSNWTDYDEKVLSPGGRIFERRAKTLTLTPEIKARFGIRDTQITPAALIKELLKAEADLLWFGGIGTYVKAAGESDTDVGDRANDALRVEAGDLRCKVIGEGANLGCTQLGRIAFAANGGRINTDFIDNSAGVDCSDHEVNIKILLDRIVADGDLTAKQRNSLLARMTDEVSSLVLRDNYLQTQAISLIEADGAAGVDNQIRLMRLLEREARLDRAVEDLPGDEALMEMAAAGRGLTRPEIAVVFAYCKIWLYDHVIDSDLPDDRHMADDVERYFPSAIQERFREKVPSHRLRRELIATSLTNSLINRVGGSFVTEIAEKTGMPPVDIARAYIIARDVYAVRDIWERIEALDNAVPAVLQTTLHREVQSLLERGTMWFLRNGGSPLDISVNVERYQTAVGTLTARLDDVVPAETAAFITQRADAYRAQGAPEDLARRVAGLAALVAAGDIVRISAARGVPMDEVARLHYSVGELLGFGWLRNQAAALEPATHWQKLALSATIEELYAHQSAITLRVMDVAGTAADGALDRWAATSAGPVDRMKGLLGELRGSGPVDLSMLTVASRQLGTLLDA